MLNDKTNYFYFVFVTPIVKDFETVNASFQSTNIDPYKQYKELQLIFKTLKNRVYNADETDRSLNNIDYGAKFKHEVHSYLSGFTGSQLSQEQKKIQEVEKRCRTFIIESISQVESRLSVSDDAFKNLAMLSPNNILSQTNKCKFFELPMISLAADNIDVIEQQYRKINLTDWMKENIFEKEIPKDTVTFWLGIYRYEHFKELSKYALQCLASPASNAIVEIMFSLVTAVKNKPRNRLELSFLDSIIRIRAHLLNNARC